MWQQTESTTKLAVAKVCCPGCADTGDQFVSLHLTLLSYMSFPSFISLQRSNMLASHMLVGTKVARPPEDFWKRGLPECAASVLHLRPGMFAMVPILPVSRGRNQQPCVSGEEELITPWLRQLPCPIQLLERTDYFARTAPTEGSALILPAYNKVLNAILAWRIKPGNYRFSVSYCKKLDLLQNNKYLHHITACKFWCFSWQTVKSKEWM